MSTRRKRTRRRTLAQLQRDPRYTAREAHRREAILAEWVALQLSVAIDALRTGPAGRAEALDYDPMARRRARR